MSSGTSAEVIFLATSYLLHPNATSKPSVSLVKTFLPSQVIIASGGVASAYPSSSIANANFC
jgi:hypothetical protein